MSPKPQGLSPKAGAGALAAIALASGTVMYWEGLSLSGYADPVGIPTACWGQTGEGIEVGKRYTLAQCQAWLDKELLHAAQGVDKCIPGPKEPHQWAALTSFAYNAGVANLCKSTLAKKANAGDWKGACAELDKWVYAKGIRLRGLIKRRAAERAMCEGRL